MVVILVVDDSEAIRETLAKALRRYGHEIVVASNGEEGLREFVRCSPDLVILDIVMPRMEGLETMARMRSHDQGVKIIAISGGGRTDQLDYPDIARKCGAQTTLRKPFDERTLVGAVEHILLTD